MAKKVEVKIPKDKLEIYDHLIANHPEVERKGKTMPYTSLNGHMFSYLSPEGVCGLRLPEKERSAFLEKYNTSLFEQHGRIMKEYVRVPDAVFEDLETMAAYLQISFDYIRTLQPKPGKKKT